MLRSNRWYVPFSRWIPHWTFSLALLLEWEPIVACVYQPFLDELYTAKKWEWSYMNWNIISVSSKSLQNRYPLLNCLMWPWMKYDTTEIFKELFCSWSYNHNVDTRSVAYTWCLVAKWSLEGCIFPWTEPHDCAAVDLLVREAWWLSTSLFWNK